jgi:hypothetical protein
VVALAEPGDRRVERVRNAVFRRSQEIADSNRSGYHNSPDTLATIELDDGAALAASVIE